MSIANLPLPTKQPGFSGVRTVKSRRFSGTREAAEAWCKANNEMFSNRHRDTDIKGGNRYFIVNKDSQKKGNYAVYEVRTV